MLLKIGVNIQMLDWHLLEQFDYLDYVFRKYAKRECIITSGNDSLHSRNSLHYRWKAIDIRTVDLYDTVVKTIYEQINDKLKPIGFDVVLEKNHIHIEYDPKV